MKCFGQYYTRQCQCSEIVILQFIVALERQCDQLCRIEFALNK